MKAFLRQGVCTSNQICSSAKVSPRNHQALRATWFQKAFTYTSPVTAIRVLKSIYIAIQAGRLADDCPDPPGLSFARFDPYFDTIAKLRIQLPWKL